MRNNSFAAFIFIQVPLCKNAQTETISNPSGLLLQHLINVKREITWSYMQKQVTSTLLVITDKESVEGNIEGCLKRYLPGIQYGIPHEEINKLFYFFTKPRYNY